MCLRLAISICRREKYFAKIKIKINFAGSEGCNEKAPMVNQLLVPWTTPATKNNKMSEPMAAKNKAIRTLLARRNLKSRKLKIKKMANAMAIQTNCRP